MSRDAQLGELDADRDKPAVYAWLRSYLRWHLGIWSRAAGLHWNSADIDDHIDAQALVERDWNELAQAARDDSQLVIVARASGRPIGIIHAQEREDRYLRVPLGLLCWIFVEPVSRGSGVSGMLIDASREWMQGRGLHAAEVFVTAENHAALTVYQRGGYRIVDHRLIARLGEPGDR
jgi:GNAT superfamily N-acetyltransferase